MPQRTIDLKERLLEFFPSLEEARLSLIPRIDKYKSIDPNTGCWLWIASVDSQGYAQIKITHNGKVWTALVDKLYYFVHWFEIPPQGLCLIHKCDNPRCFSPDHVYLANRKQNALDMVLKGRHGNEYTKRLKYEYHAEDIPV